jgi:hypothetical protein
LTLPSIHSDLAGSFIDFLSYESEDGLYLEIEEEDEVRQGVDTKTVNLMPILIKNAYIL